MLELIQQQKCYKIEDEDKKFLIASKDNFTNSTKYNFEKIFDEESKQEELFKHICMPLIDELFKNKKSCLLFAYGMTNSGKTHTIIGK